MSADRPRVLVLGAGGLIGGAIACDLLQHGFPLIAAARRLTAAQMHLFGESAREVPLMALDRVGLERLIKDSGATIVVNCLGVLQDNAGDDTREVHTEFIERLIEALGAAGSPLLVHISIPGHADGDRTAFSRTKRDADQAILQSGLRYAILRPGFVFAPRAYGGSAMLRALAALPVTLPKSLGERPLGVVAVEDVVETVVALALQHETHRAVVWDLMHPAQTTLNGAVLKIRAWLGSLWRFSPPLPLILMKLGAWCGDSVAWLGWRPAIRSTALAELQRGVTGDPQPWMAATGIMPRTLDAVLRERPATVQDKWFARLYLLKAAVVASLVIFWCASAAIALFPAYSAAVEILTSRGYAVGFSHFVTIAGSLMDFSVGLAIAFRRTHRAGLVAGIAVSLFYMIGALLMTPDLWVEPLGALVKTFPAIVLMAVALAMSDDR